MKKLYKIPAILVLLLLAGIETTHGITTTWLGTVSTSWNDASNWNLGIPDSTDDLIIASNAPYNLTLTQNRRVNSFTIGGDTLDLGTYTLTTTGVNYFNGGKVLNGNLNISGSLCHFGGAVIDARIEATCGYYHMNGGIFLKPVILVSTGAASTSGSGNCVFEDSLSVTNNGSYYFYMGSTYGDSYTTLTITNNSTHEVFFGSTDTTFISGNLILNNTSTGGIVTGTGNGVTYLSSGKTITIGSSGFTNNYLTLKNFYQQGSTSQTLTLTGTAILNLINANFEGNLTVTTPGILLKNSTFNGTTSITRNGTSGSFHCDGGNTFAGPLTLTNSATSGRLRMANTTPDIYLGNVTFNSTNGQDVQIAYTGNNIFEGNITINSNKVVFNTSNGKVTFAGGNSQTLNGSYNFPFKKLAIDKSANHVTANTTLSVDDSLIFVSGNLITTSTNLLTMKHGSTASGASNASFVSGPVKKTGNSAFQFPVGKGTHFRLVEITAPSNSTDAFTAEYFDTSQTSGSTMDTTITFISDCGYWNLSRTTGSSNITPKFAFDSTHCDFLTVKPVHIVIWNGTKWVDKGEGVNDSNTKKTSTAVTSYGNYALAYKLIPGDAPQMPYPLTMDIQCNATELLFTSDDLWFSFSPDSALIKTKFRSPDEEKLYAVVKKATIYEEYSPFDTLVTVSSKSWQVDSLLEGSLTYVDSLTPSSNYLMKITKFNSNDGEGIYDTTDYYLNVCMLNLRMATTPLIRVYNDAAELSQWLSTANGGDVLVPGNFTKPLDISLFAPMEIESGVTLVGNYDLLSEPFDVTAGVYFLNIPTTPYGTLFYSKNRGPASATSTGTSPYMFVMAPQSEIRNIRLQGAMTGTQDYNQDDLLCAGIKVDQGSSLVDSKFSIAHCEIYNFSYAAVFVRANSDNLTINNCNIHHVKGGGGETTAKGYGVWIQGKTANAVNIEGTNFYIKNSIFDESKEGIDTQPNPTNTTVDSCTFGQIFFNENINRHKYGGLTCTTQCTYIHPSPGLWTPPSNCFYYSDHKNNTCTSSAESLSSEYSIYGPAAGNTFIENSIFHQDAKIISLPYPANSKVTIPVYTPDFNPTPLEYTNPVYNIRMRYNTFAAKQNATGTFSTNCGLGGYARIHDIYVEECTWDFEREHTKVGTNADPNDPNPPNYATPILMNSPNSFAYSPGVGVTNSSSAQPPEVKMEFDALNFVPGYSPNHSQVPYYAQLDNITVTLSHGTVGTQSQNVTYIVRAKVSEGTPIHENQSANNGYNNNQVVTEPSSTNVDLTNTNDFNWDTNKPGLFGIDAYAVDGNYSSTACSPYYTSTMIHQPVIIVPDDNYMLIFNIKDSYYADLYGSTTTTGVKKQVVLNDVIIWEEDIARGGDDWERVELNLNALGFLDDLNIQNFKNNLIFSIAIPDPSLVSTGGVSGNVLKGVEVWVDDIYLKKVDSPENLIRDGDVENSIASELPIEPSNTCIWYVKYNSVFNAYHIDDSDFAGICTTSNNAKSRAFLASVDRKSGFKAISLNLPGLNSSGDCSQSDYTPVQINPLDQIISVAVDFDTRDFISCDDFVTKFNYSNASFSMGAINGNHVIDQNIILTGDLNITGCILLFKPHNPPYTITVPNTRTLAITGNSPEVFMGGCKNMWGGIIVEPGGVLNINGAVTASSTNFVTIEDAEIAILADGNGSAALEPTVIMTHTTFNKNKVALQFEHDTYSSSFIEGCLFKCDNGFISKDASIPVFYPEKHIYLDGAIDLTIMGASNEASVFQDVLIGILASNSDVITKYCEFNDLIDHANFPNKGYGIVAFNFDPTVRTVDVFRCRFNRLYQGISTLGNFNATIDNNTIDYFRDMDNIAISINSMNYLNDIEIKNNKEFLNCNIGIKIAGSNLNNVFITNNKFINSNFVETSAGSFHNTAITIQSPIANTGSVVEVFDNEITDFRIGIHARNVQSLSIGANTSGGIGNVITFDQLSFDDNYHGIWIEDCDGALVQGNEINKTDPALPSGTFTVEGLTIDECTSGFINLNDINELQTPVHVIGACDDTEFHCNDFINNTNSGAGVLMTLAKLPEQGDALNSITWANSWEGYGGNVFGVTGTVGSFFEWPYDLIDQKYNPNPLTGLIGATGLNGTSFWCAVAAVPDDADRDLRYGPVVDDTLSFIDFEQEFDYKSKQYLFNLIKEDSTLLIKYTSKDSLFANFNLNIAQTNIGKFYKVDSLLLDGDLTAAETLRSSITDTNQIETNLKIVLGLLINKVLRDSILNSGDTLTLEEIAWQNPITGGKAVFMARALLFLEIHSENYASRVGLVNDASVIDENIVLNHFSVAPNPANSLCSVYFDNMKCDFILTVKNMLGQTLFETKLPANSQSLEIPIASFDIGMYLVTINDNIKIHELKKLIIVR